MFNMINEGFNRKYSVTEAIKNSKKNRKKIVEAVERPEEFADYDDNMNPINYGMEENFFDTEDVSVESEEKAEVAPKEIFHNDNGKDYTVIERSRSGRNALLQRGGQWVIAWNCPESNEGSWGQGHYFFDEETARKAWEDKYLNESAVANARTWLMDKEGKTPKETEEIINNSSPEEIEKIALNYVKKNKEESLKESIKRIISRLNEAEISPEDKRESDILRNIYKKIDGKKIGKNTFTPEEQDVINKYGLDVWGYRGDSKVVTGTGRKEIINPNEFQYRWRHPANADKINYADRARKIDDRDYAQQVNRRKNYGQSFDDAEKEMQNRKQSERINQMKSALRSRKYYQNEIDNADDNLERELNRIDNAAEISIADANKRMRDSNSWSRKSVDAAEKRINDILDKHRVKECMNQLREATSPEDKRESDILRNIYYKIQNRSNAKLTPEEQEVVDKYNLVRTYDRNLKANDTNDYLFRRGEGESRSTWGSTTPNRKINYADRARKLGTRDYAQTINNRWAYGKTFNDKERDLVNQEISQDVQDMKAALSDRRYHKDNLEKSRKQYDDNVAKINDKRETDMERRKAQAADDLVKYKQEVDNKNKEIKKLLGKEESLKEDVDDKRVIKTGLSGVKNEEILKSVMGQMSDGIWENSPGMDGYWLPADIDSCNVLVDNNQFIKYGTDRYGASKYIENKYYRKSDDEVRRFFANKIKHIAQEYLNDNNLNPYSDWRPDNDEVCSYLDRGSGVTIADAYAAYKALK